MQLTIHRGTHEIGGSCVELVSKNARILIDIGLPLNDEALRSAKKLSKQQLLEQEILPGIQGLYDNPDFDAVLISHAHLDHYGLLSYVHKDIPVYVSKGAEKLINLTSILNNQLTPLSDKTQTVVPWKSFLVKDVKITAYLMDHSGFDSLAFLIEADGKRIFYTGDFRAHGRKKVVFENLLKNPVKDIDYLITEGTMLSRENEVYKTEVDLEKELSDYLKHDNKLTLLSCSSQNIDRLVSAYRACLKTNTLFVIDPYTACILDSLKDVSGGIPQYDWKDNVIKILFLPNKHTKRVLEELGLYRFGSAKITLDEIVGQKQKMLIKDSYTMRNILRNKNLLSNRTLIYSQWEGYLNERLQNFWKTNEVDIVQQHVSGHAYFEDIQKLADSLDPKFVIPIHTEFPEKFKNLKGHNIKYLKDGQKVEL